MKIIYYSLITFSLFIVFACSSDPKNDLEQMKDILEEKKTELKNLELEINNLKDEINILSPKQEKKAIAVEVMEIKKKDFTRTAILEGRVESDEMVNISSEVGGRIIHLNVKEGQLVQKGQLVATTDMSTLEMQIAEIETNLSLASTVYERQERLWKQNIGSELQYLQAQTSKESLEKSLKTLKSQINKKHIYSPISGIVDREFLKQGETASPGMPIVQILNTHKVKIVADAQENFLSSLNKGDDVEVFFPALNKTIRQKISMIGRTIDPSNRTFKIEIASNSMNGQLKPNLLAELTFNDYSEKEVIIIPLEAMQEEVSGQKFVYLLENIDGKLYAKKSLIVLGESRVGEAIVISGINQGDSLITKGGKSLTNGDQVSI